MVYSAWKILFSIIADMVNSNPKTTYEKQWNLIHDLSILTKPHVLKEEGYPVIHAKSLSSSSQRVYIFSYFNFLTILINLLLLRRVFISFHYVI